MSSNSGGTATLIQLSAKGVQNIYLDLSPQYTFFKRSFRRHTNYAVQAVMVAAQNQIGWNRQITFPISRNGDLLAETYFCAYLPCCGVDTKPNMFAKSLRGVVTNHGLMGSAHNVMDARFTHPSEYNANPSQVKREQVYAASGGVAGSLETSAAGANVLDSGSIPSLPEMSGTVERVQAKTSQTGGGMIPVPKNVADRLGSGLGTDENASTRIAQEFLQGDDHANVAYVNALGHAMIDYAEFSIGGNSINRHTGEYLHIWHLMNNKSGDPTYDDNLFAYGDGTGMPLPETGSSAPHAFVEHQHPFFNETGKYKLCKFTINVPKSQSGGLQRQLGDRMNSYRLLEASGNQIEGKYTDDELIALQNANAGAFDGPVIRDGTQLPLRFFRNDSIIPQSLKTRYVTDFDRSSHTVPATYELQIYDANPDSDSNAKRLSGCVAQAYITAQGGAHMPCMDVHNWSSDKPRSYKGETTKETTALLHASQYFEGCAWNDETFNAQVVGDVGRAANDKDLNLSYYDIQMGSDANRKYSRAKDEKTAGTVDAVHALTAAPGLYAIDNAMPHPGVTEVRHMYFGGRGGSVADAAGDSANSGNSGHADSMSAVDALIFKFGTSTTYNDGADAAVEKTKNGTSGFEPIFGEFRSNQNYTMRHKDANGSGLSVSGFHETSAQGDLLGLPNSTENQESFRIMVADMNQQFGHLFTTSMSVMEPSAKVKIHEADYMNMSSAGAGFGTGSASNATDYVLENMQNAVRLTFTATAQFTRDYGDLTIECDLARNLPSALTAQMTNPNTGAHTGDGVASTTDTAVSSELGGRIGGTGIVTSPFQQGVGNTADATGFAGFHMPKNRYGSTGDGDENTLAEYQWVPDETNSTRVARFALEKYPAGSAHAGEYNGSSNIVAVRHFATSYITGSVGVKAQAPGKISPDSIQFIVYKGVNQVSDVNQIREVPAVQDGTGSASQVVKKAYVKLVKTAGTVGFESNGSHILVETPDSDDPIAFGFYRNSTNASMTNNGMTSATGLKKALNVATTANGAYPNTNAFFLNDKYRCVVPPVSVSALGSAVPGIPLLGPRIADGVSVLDLKSFYEACTAPRIAPLSSTDGFTGPDGSGLVSMTEFDQKHGVVCTDTLASAGVSNTVSFLALAPDLMGGTKMQRGTDNGVFGADGITDYSFGRNTASAAAPSSSESTGVTRGHLAVDSDVLVTGESNARRSTVEAASAGVDAAVRGHDARYDVDGADDESGWKSVKHVKRRYRHSDHSKVASGAGAVAHKLESDFITTSAYAAGTVSLSAGSKKALKDGFAKRAHMSTIGNHDHPEGSGRCVKVMVPLPFWYTRSGNKVCNAGRTQVLPIIALQYHDCQVTVKLRAKHAVVQTDHEARNVGLRCTGMQGINGALLKDGAGAQTLTATNKAALKSMVTNSVITTATKNGGFAFDEPATASRVTFAGNKVAYGKSLAAFGGPGVDGKPVTTAAAALSAASTGQMGRTDLGARSFAVPQYAGTGLAMESSSGTAGDIIDAFLLCQTIFLDSNERRLFASHTHEYLITQVQSQEFNLAPQTKPEFTMLSLDCKLNFNHPISQIYWVCQRPESQATRNYFRYEGTHMGGDDLMIKAALSFNSHDRENADHMDSMFCRTIQPQTYFDTAPAGGVGHNLRDSSEGGGKNIYMYSFAQHPKEWWPSGNINMSRIDTATLRLWFKGHASQAHVGHHYTYAGGGYHKLADEVEFATTAAGHGAAMKKELYYGTLSKGINVRVYAQNYNIGRCMSGMFALKYAN